MRMEERRRRRWGKKKKQTDASEKEGQKCSHKNTESQEHGIQCLKTCESKSQIPEACVWLCLSIAFTLSLFCLLHHLFYLVSSSSSNFDFQKHIIRQWTETAAGILAHRFALLFTEEGERFHCWSDVCLCCLYCVSSECFASKWLEKCSSISLTCWWWWCWCMLLHSLPPPTTRL